MCDELQALTEQRRGLPEWAIEPLTLLDQLTAFVSFCPFEKRPDELLISIHSDTGCYAVDDLVARLSKSRRLPD